MVKTVHVKMSLNLLEIIIIIFGQFSLLFIPPAQSEVLFRTAPQNRTRVCPTAGWPVFSEKMEISQLKKSSIHSKQKVYTSILNSATGTPLLATCGANMAAG